jgi:hypothetical protein
MARLAIKLRPAISLMRRHILGAFRNVVMALTRGDLQAGIGRRDDRYRGQKSP